MTEPADAPLVSPEYVRTMARYNRWQNEQIYSCAGELEPSELTRGRKLFFGSIQRTLEHVLVADRFLLRRIQAKEKERPFDPNARLAQTFEELHELRRAFDAQLVEDAAGYDAAWLAQRVSTWSDRLQRHRELQRAFWFMQLFNHQAHHRGQVTAQLTKLGVDYGPTDLPACPDCDG